MPRKKLQKRIGDGQDLSVEIASPMVQCLESIPPGLFVMLSRTAEQKQKWKEEKQFFACVAALMRADFLGEPDPDYSKMERNRVREIASYKWRFIAFFRMVRANWPAVKKALQVMEIRLLPEIGLEAGPTARIPQIPPEELNSPSELELEVIRIAAIGRIICAYTPDHMPIFTPRRIHGDIEKTDKARWHGATDTVLQNSIKASDRWYEWNEWWDLERKCLDAVRASNPRDEAASCLHNYVSSIRLQEEIAKSKFDKRSKPKVEIWRNGRPVPHDELKKRSK